MTFDLSLKRQLADKLFTIFCYICTAFSIIVVLAILWMLFSRGIYAFFTMPIFTASTPGPGLVGGLINAIYGSFIMTASAMLFATPLGILIAVYFIDVGRDNGLTRTVQFLNDVLLSIPSIIVGLFIYLIIVRTMGHFSAIAGTLALVLIALPIIIRASEDVLRLTCDPLREAAFALGASHVKVAYLMVVYGARNGIITAMLLAGARIFGETAPLLFTALSNQFFTTDMREPMANLPVVIFQYALSPYTSWQTLAWGGALLLTLLVLTTNIIAQLLAQKRSVIL